jgi:hypothetical protein
MDIDASCVVVDMRFMYFIGLGKKHFNHGRVHTTDAKRNMADARKRFYSVPMNRKRLVGMSEKRWSNRKAHIKMSRIMLKKWSSPEYRKLLSESAKRSWKNYHIKSQRLKCFLRGENHPMFGKKHTEQALTKMRRARRKQTISQETRKKIGQSSLAAWGRDVERRAHLTERMKIANPMYDFKNVRKCIKSNSGKKRSLEFRLKCSKAKSGENHPNYGKHLSLDVRLNISKSLSGSKSHNWKGGKSFEPYPSYWNNSVKSIIINSFGGVCALTGEINSLNKKTGKRKKLSVHHIDNNKRNCSLDNLIPLTSKIHSRITAFPDDDKMILSAYLSQLNDECLNGGGLYLK